MSNIGKELRSVALTDKYDVSIDDIFATGTQVLVRMCLEQAARDRATGLNTAGYVTGYRGSPLGAVDAEFGRAANHLAAAQITYQPGLNEDLAATALWGTQQAEMRGDGRHDGVFGLWYAKGPGVDRSGDALRHANLAGTSAAGGVLAVFGDDHTCESSTTSHQSEFAFVDAMIPVLNPANIQELFEYALHGWALSRFAGTWVGLKCVKDNVESTASVKVGKDEVPIILPERNIDLNIRRTDTPQDQEKRLHEQKIPAVLTYIRANGLNRETLPKTNRSRIGVVTTGKSYSDTLQALYELGIPDEAAEKLGLCLIKVGVPWPLEPEGLRIFADGLDQILVVEEKRGLIEDQLRAILYDLPRCPVVVGKRDESGAILFPSAGALDPVMIADVIGTRLAALSPENDDYLRDAREAVVEKMRPTLAISDTRRTPYFCAGCPHSSSTRLPEGARGYAGIGCHYMSQFMNRGVDGYTHMGGEGANWLGESRFSKRKHMFQNIGDGTYNHSGLLSIRAAVAAGTNVTFKILNNDAVALTGGQALEGALDSNKIAREVLAAGARKVVLVSDDPDRHSGENAPPSEVRVAHRDTLIAVQKELAQIEGVTVLVYEQTCAAEKRRRRKKGSLDDPARRVFINTDVCEGCGDCGVQSNCVAILPQDTHDGRKRQIDQSACNKDFSCLKGFCPSFVTIEGGNLKKSTARELTFANVPEPADRPSLDTPFSAIITGIGGTGVVTIGAILGMAAHLEGKGCGIIDMAGLAQKGGAVTSHVKLSQKPENIATIRASAGGADLILACDTLLLADPAVSKVLGRGKTHVVANAHETMTGEFIHNRDLELPTTRILDSLRRSVGANATHVIDATQIARHVYGDAIAANMFLLGYAYQAGLIPLGAEAILRAIELNGAAVPMNQAAFMGGRSWQSNPQAAETSLTRAQKPEPETLDQAVSRREAFLTEYQNAGYARRYRSLVGKVRSAEEALFGKAGALSSAVALTAYRVMAYKDEYEVARLLSAETFKRKIHAQFQGEFKVRYHLAPPLLSRINPSTGRPDKRSFGPWLSPILSQLARFKWLRGSRLDPFGRTQERQRERALIKEFEDLMTEVAQALDTDNYDAAVALAELPRDIRGFGPVKMAAFERYDAALPEALDAFRNPDRTRNAA